MQIGSDVEQLEQLGRTFQAVSQNLLASAGRVSRTVNGLPWSGRDAQRFRSSWSGTQEPSVRGVAHQLHVAAERLRAEASEQRSASSATSIPVALGVVGMCTEQQYPFSGARDGSTGSSDTLNELLRSKFLSEPNGEIEIRKLDNGKYIVILPGVSDLTSAGSAGGRAAIAGRRYGLPGAAIFGTKAVLDEMAAPNEKRSVQDMRYAIPAATDGSTNLYADVVRQKMRDAGVPSGADVMLVGHSFGAYTAIDLANDRSFNATSGSGYHVNVTHVVAAAADTGWKLDELPEHTNALVFNNRLDAVVLAEDALHRDKVGHSGVLNVDFVGGIDGFGHDPSNYAAFVADPGKHNDVRAWLADVGNDYSGPGVATRVAVEDPEFAQ